MAVMGKTLEHLGSQLYKRRDAAIAELVANSWDAGAAVVDIDVPDLASYNRAASSIVVSDTGTGMTPDQIDAHYLVVGRNRRSDQEEPAGRRVMGRKGIGKLAGFGIATEIELVSWVDGSAARVVMPIDDLKKAPGSLESVELSGEEAIAPPKDRREDHGTRVIMRGLRHSTPVDPAQLRASLARRFSRTVRGEMEILVNGQMVQDPAVEFDFREPETGWEEADVEGNKVRYFFGFSPRILTPSENRGFVVYVHGKTAQAPPFFFDVEATATGQHGTRYLFGAIEADFLDDGSDDDSDVISTDRQEIDWQDPRTESLRAWGADLTRRALREHRDRKEDQSEDWVLNDPQLKPRIERLDRHSKKRVTSFVRSLGRAEDSDQESVLRLASSLISAFEYQHFHDFLGDLEEVEDDPERLAELLSQMLKWKALESRAILEVIQGRLQVVDKFHSMIASNAPETAPRVGDENLHDLLTTFPWLLNPQWQVFEHEKRVDTQLREWNSEEQADDAERVDFLALSGERTLVVVEIKRPGIAVSLEEFQRLQRYLDRLRGAWTERHGGGEVLGLLVCTELGFDEAQIGVNVRWERWADLHLRVKDLYEHYRAVLEQETNSGQFAEREREIARTRAVIEAGAYLDKSKGKPDLGPN